MDTWQEFLADPLQHPVIPYVALAGYRLGRDIPRPAPRFDVTDYGARGDGRHDDTAAINAAVFAAGRAGGGCVAIPPGRYVLSDVIRVCHDDVVLRGAGSSLTILTWRRPLQDLLGVSKSRFGGDSSAWSWSGGLIWVCGAARLRRVLAGISAGDWPREGWLDRGEAAQHHLAAVSAPARRGDSVLTVDSTRCLRPDQRVILLWSAGERHSLLRHIAGDVEGAHSYPWEEKRKLLSYLPYAWPVQIERVEDGHILLRQPLPLDIREEWRVRLVTPDDPITGVGVEGMTISLPQGRMERHLQDRGYNGIAFQCAWDCWCSDVVFDGGENGLILVSSKSVTAREVTVSGVNRHHSFACREQSHDNLFTRFQILLGDEAGSGPFHHGINVEALSSGNVWSKGRMAAGTFDSHRGLPFGNVRTDIEVCNDGWMSGSGDAGPRYGARFAHWNITVTNGRAKGMKIDNMAPRSLTAGVSGADADTTPEDPDYSGDIFALLEPSCPDGPAGRDLHAAQRQLTIDRNGENHENPVRFR
ncbi:glycosyl hydrolase family 28-related protein [Streptomyces sp. NPDC058676]|uniref:glycosyl hydrolase family 28-related protein n=1 Tax=unclassified Streptomyces TaxID=2593676 RepID=UPI003668E02C